MIIPQNAINISNISQVLLESFINIQSKTKTLLNPLAEKDLEFFFKQQNNSAIGEYLSSLDDLFANSLERKKHYTIKQIRSRTIITTLGSITFKRRQYQSRKDGTYFYYIDHLIELESRERLSTTLKLEILKMLTKYTYLDTAKRFDISKNTVYKTVRSLSGIILETPDFEANKKIDVLYIQADECYAALQKKQNGKKTNKVIVEEVVVHEGLTPLSKNRNELQNKTLFTRAFNETSEDFYERIYRWILKNYHYREIYFYGDGGAWIKSCAEYLSATFILDLFHTMQAVVRITTDKEMRSQLQKAIRNDNQILFAETIVQIKEIKQLSPFKQKQVDYLFKNWKYIQRNFKLPHSVGCSQEGINFHYFASRLTTLPKGWSLENLRTIAQIICLYQNETSERDFAIQIAEAIALNQLDDVTYNVNEILSSEHQYYRNTKMYVASPKIS